MTRTNIYRQGAQEKAITVAARLTGRLLNEVAKSYTHNLCVISLVMQTFKLDILVVGFLEISYHIASMTCKVMEAYNGEHISYILIYEFKHITKTDVICVIKAAFPQGLSWFH